MLLQPSDPVLQARADDGVELVANRATALALVRAFRTTGRWPSAGIVPVRAGFRGDQWAVGYTFDLTEAGFVVLRTDAEVQRC